jgi:hypothetical protein
VKPARNWLEPIDAHWFGPVPAWPLAVFRMGFAFVLLCYYADRFAYLWELFGDTPARLPDLAMDAQSRWKFLQAFYWGALSQPAALAAAALFTLAALALLVGYRARAAAGVLCLWMLLRILFEWHTAFSIDRSSVLVLGVLALSPCSRVLSVDALRAAGLDEGRAPGGASGWREVMVSGWATRTLQWLLLSWYVLAGLSKLAGSWDLIPNYDVLYSQVQGWYENDLAFWALQHVPKPVFTLLQQMALYFELYAPLLLVPRRLRPIGMLIGIGMHVGVAALMAKLWLFSAEMICFYALFLPLSGGSSCRDAPS